MAWSFICLNGGSFCTPRSDRVGSSMALARSSRPAAEEALPQLIRELVVAVPQHPDPLVEAASLGRDGLGF